jgi:8-oxo-dGTP diphosphatase
VELGTGYHGRDMTSSPHCKSIETIARCVILREDAVLLCGALDGQGNAKYWYLPGGHVEPGETAREAVAREMVEEAGVEVEVGACALVSENHFTQVKAKSGTEVRRHEYTFVFLANTPATTIESREHDLRFAWFPLTTLADVRPASHRAWLLEHAEELRTGRTPPLRFHVEQS